MGLQQSVTSETRLFDRRWGGSAVIASGCACRGPPVMGRLFVGVCRSENVLFLQRRTYELKPYRQPGLVETAGHAQAAVACQVHRQSVDVGEIHLQRVVRDGGAVGNLAHDAHIAALVVEHGVSELWTTDKDFRRFPGLVVRDPFDDSGVHERRRRYAVPQSSR